MTIGRRTIKSTRNLQRKLDKVFAIVGYTVLTLYFLYLTCVWLSLRPSFFIEQVNVVGAHAVSSESIANIASGKLSSRLLFRIRRDNELLYPLEEARKEILALSPRIANVQISFPNKHEIVVAVTEYTPNFLYCMRSDRSLNADASSTAVDRQPKDCYFADEDGYVYAEAPEYIGYPFVAIVASTTEEAVTHESPIGTKVLSSKTYSAIKTYIDDLSRVGLTSHSLTLLGGQDIRVEVGMPWVIIFDLSKDPDTSIQNLGIVLANLEQSPQKGKDVREIDLRFGNKIFYR